MLKEHKNKLAIFFCFLLFFVIFLAVGRRPKPRTIIIGIDGMEPSLVIKLINEGRLPNAKYLMDNGGFGTHNALDAGSQEMFSPVIWTSVATGVPSQEHGIDRDTLSDMSARDDLREFFALSTSRKKPALWNIFTASGRKSAIINWWITYPAEKINGFIVSNLLNEFYWRIENGLLKETELRGAKMEGIAYPSFLSEYLFRYKEKKGLKQDAIITDIISNIDPADRVGDPDKHINFSLAASVKIAYTNDLNVLLFTEYFLENRRDLSLIMSYFEGLDTISHIFFGFTADDRLSEGKYAGYKDIVTHYYMIMDRYLGTILSSLKKDDLLIVCSDHGFQADRNSLDNLKSGNIRTGEHATKGLFVIYGRNIKKRFFVKKASVLDIVPTTLYLNGMPLPRDTAGRIIGECIDEGFMRKNIPRFTDKYVLKINKNKFPETRYPFKNDLRDRLISLGYLN